MTFESNDGRTTQAGEFDRRILTKDEDKKILKTVTKDPLLVSSPYIIQLSTFSSADQEVKEASTQNF